MSFSIREYQLDDRPSIVALMKEFGNYIESIDTEQRTEYKEGSAEYFTDKMIAFCGTKHGAIYTACSNDTVIGFINGYVDEQDADEKMETIPAIPGIVGEFFVTEKFRGQEVGKQLLQQIEKYLRSQKCTIVRFPVFAPNMIARRFYEKAGYVERLIYIMKEL